VASGVTYDMSQLTATSQAWAARNRKAAITAMVSAAERVKGLYVGRVDEVRAVDTGRLKSSFVVTATANGATLSNEAPYFSVMDEGRRAGTAGPPMRAIFEWVLRKRLVVNKAGKGRTRASVLKSPSLTAEAKSIAFLIRRSIRRKGIKPREITTLPSVVAQIPGIIAAEIDAAITIAGAQP